MADRYPLVVDATDNKIKEIPSGDNLQLTGNDIIGVVDITASGNIAAAQVNATSIRKGGTEIATVATTGAYSDLTGAPSQLSDLTNDRNFLEPGDNVGILTNNVGYLTTVAFADLTDKPTTIAGYGITDAATSAQGALASTAIQPGGLISRLTNDSGFLTATDINNGTFTVDVNNTGDLIGSVFADDSTVMIDSILAAVNLDQTIRGHVKPFQDSTWDLGGSSNKFKDLYLSGKANGTIVATAGTAPTASGDAGDVGEIRFDDNYIYIKTSGAGWKRAALSSLV
jgi:hypothetical protein